MLGEQALDHFRLHLVRREGDFDQLAAAAATSAAALVSGPATAVAASGDRSRLSLEMAISASAIFRS